MVSGQKVWWLCKNSHEWTASISNRNRGRGCQECAIPVWGDRARKYEIRDLQEYAKSKGGLCLSKVYISSTQKVQWMCSAGHSFKADWMHVKWQNNWCKYCVGRGKTIEDLKKLAKERGGFCLSTTYEGAFVQLEWKCQKSHIWRAVPDSVLRGTWCPECNIHRGEKICRIFLEQAFGVPFCKARPSWLKSVAGTQLELDGYSEDLGIAFEHQGRQHHSLVEKSRQFKKRFRTSNLFR